MKVKNCHLACIGLVISLIFISGCEFPRSYDTFHVAGSTPVRDHGISPIYPAMNYGYANRYKAIDTLMPELKWKDLKTTNQTYEVCIWEAPYRSIEDVKKKADQFQASWGISVYYTNNIATNFHQITLRLKPDTYYNWSVRIHDGKKVGNWSSFSQQEAVLSVIYDRDNTPFGFKTPVQ